MLSNHLILCRPLLLLPSIFPNIRGFSNESALCIRQPKYRRFSFNISPYNEHPGQISFRMDWLDLLAVQGTLKSLLQHHSSKASILCSSAFYIVQLSHPYMTTGTTLALTRWTFVDCRGPASAGSRGYPQDERHWREREKTRDTILDRAKSVREREKERERVTRQGMQQNLAYLYFLP